MSTRADRLVRARAKSLKAVQAHNAALRPVLTGPANPVSIGYVRRSSATKLTPTQRNSEGSRSEWSMTQNYFTDPKWSATVSTT